MGFIATLRQHNLRAPLFTRAAAISLLRTASCYEHRAAAVLRLPRASWRRNS